MAFSHAPRAGGRLTSRANEKSARYFITLIQDPRYEELLETPSGAGNGMSRNLNFATKSTHSRTARVSRQVSRFWFLEKGLVMQVP